MLNFLQQKDKNQIICEYLLRVIFFLLVFIFISSLILISLFLPSFFFTKLKNDTVSKQLDLVKQKNISSGGDPIAFIKDVNKLSIALSDNTGSGTSNTDIINKIVSLKNKGIKILSIVITEKKDFSREILINGVAKTRDNLTLFSNDIRTDGFFKSTVFPVSNFIKSSDSEFSATLTL